MSTSPSRTPHLQPVTAFFNALLSHMWLTLVPILLLATLLRLHDLTLQSLWFDELMTWQHARFDTLAGVLASVRTDVWVPGHSLFMWAWMRLVGSSEFVLRFPAVLAGVMTVAAIYTLARRLANRRVALIAALFTAVLHAPIYYSQEARPYAALLLYSTVAGYLWLRIMGAISRDERPPPVVVGGYVLTVLIILYYNYFGVVLLGLHLLGTGLWHLAHPRRWPPLALIYGLVALGYLPWVPEMLNDLSRSSYYVLPPKRFIVELLTYFHFLLNAQVRWVDAGLVLVGVALAAEGWRAWRGGQRVRWLLIPFLVTYLYSALSSKSLLVDRYLLISAPAGFILFAWVLDRLPLPRLLLWLAAGGVSVLMLYNLVYEWDYYHRPTKAQFREVAQVAMRHNPGGDVLVVGFTGHPGTATHFDYYFQQAGSDLRVDVGGGWADDTGVLAPYVAGADRPEHVWLVAAFNPVAPEFLAYLDRYYDVTLTEEYFRAQVWLFEKEER